MPDTDPAAMGPGVLDAALAQAAGHLEAVTTAYQRCIRSLEAAEATVDALLDDARRRVMVVDGQHRVTAVSRGMAALIGTRDVVGRAAADVLPSSWPPVGRVAAAAIAADGWVEVPLGDDLGRLCVRRLTEDDAGSLILVRHEFSA